MSEKSAKLNIPTYDDVLAAHERMKPFIHRTPVLTCTHLNDLTGAELFFKCENYQKAGAFKVRGFLGHDVTSSVCSRLSPSQSLQYAPLSNVSEFTHCWVSTSHSAYASARTFGDRHRPQTNLIFLVRVAIRSTPV